MTYNAATARLGTEIGIERVLATVKRLGVERPLKKFQDWERFTGQKAKVILKEPLEGNLKHFDGVIAAAARDSAMLHRQLLEAFDAELSRIFAKLREGDLLILTARDVLAKLGK